MQEGQRKTKTDTIFCISLMEGLSLMLEFFYIEHGLLLKSEKKFKRKNTDGGVSRNSLKLLEYRRHRCPETEFKEDLEAAAEMGGFSREDVSTAVEGMQ